MWKVYGPGDLPDGMGVDDLLNWYAVAYDGLGVMAYFVEEADAYKWLADQVAK